MNEVKKKLREKYRYIRANLPDKISYDKIITKKTIEFLNAKKYNSIFIYQSYLEEVDTSGIIAELIKQNKQIYFPKIVDKNMILCHYLTNNIIDTCEYTVVPLIAYDSKNYRLGFGGGYYDKFLANNKTYGIGLAYVQQFCNNLPIEKHDISLDKIITN